MNNPTHKADFNRNQAPNTTFSVSPFDIRIRAVRVNIKKLNGRDLNFRFELSFC